VRERIRARLARHENLFALLWFAHLVRNEDPGEDRPGWLRRSWVRWQARRAVRSDPANSGTAAVFILGGTGIILLILCMVVAVAFLFNP
jgi:hypothetical protein